MTKQPNYKTRPGGSIDYRHYLDHSARLRSQEFRTAGGAVLRAIRHIFTRPSVTEPAPAQPVQVQRPRVSLPARPKPAPPAKRPQRSARIAQI